MDNLYFGVGENAGKILTDIAREKLLIDCNPEKALEVFTKSIIGFPKELAIEVLIGDKVLKVVNNDIVLDEGVDSEGLGYISNYIESRILEIRKVSKEFIESLKKIIEEDSEFNISTLINLSELFEDIFENEIAESLNIPIIRYVKSLKKFIDNSTKFINTVEWLHIAYGDSYIDPKLTISPKELIYLISSIKDIINNKYPDFFKTNDEYNLDNFFKREHSNQEILSKGLQETPASQYFDGGWLSPEGKFYGLNGDYNSFIHIKIAEELKNKGIILEKDEDEDEDPYQWLENNGWIKLHYNIVHFCPLVPGESMPNFITEDQQKFLVEWSKNHYKGILKFGYRFEELSYTKFGSMESFMLTDLFK